MNNSNNASSLVGRRRLGYWAIRTDAELLRTDFDLVGDPERLENVLDQVPDTDEVPRVEFTYDTRGGEMVRCRHCKVKAKNHHLGFVLRYDDGSRILLGRDCGAKQFGETFVQQHKEYVAAVKRAGILRRIMQLRRLRTSVRDDLEELEAAPCWREYMSLKRKFLLLVPEVSDKFVKAVRSHDGVLYALQQVPDHEASADFERRTGRHVIITKKAEVPVHRLRGGSFFDLVGDLGEDVRVLARRARNTLHRLCEEELSDIDVQLCFSGLNSILSSLRDKAALIGEVPHAFSSANISGITKWMMTSGIVGIGELRIEGNRLYCCNKRGETRAFDGHRKAEMMLPQTWPEVPIKTIRRIEAALAEADGSADGAAPEG